MRRDSGSALVLALGVLAVVALCVLVVAAQIESQQALMRHNARHAVLAALADAAFAEALAGLAVDPEFTGAAEHGFGAGTIASSIVPVGATSRQVTATAAYQRWVASIRAEVDVTAGPRVVRVSRTQRPGGMGEERRRQVEESLNAER